MQETHEMQVLSLGGDDPLEKKVAIHSSVLAWRISHGQRSLAGYSPWGCTESDTTEHRAHAEAQLTVCVCPLYQTTCSSTEGL